MIRWSTAVVVVILAIVAAVVSFRHAYEVVTLYGEAGFTAYMVPVTIDGLVYASSMVLLDSARRSLDVPTLARWTLGLGIAATLAANVAHGWAYGVPGAVVAAWPAVALVLSYELLMGLIRRGSTTVVATVPSGTVTPADLPESPPAVPETTEYVPDDLKAAAASTFFADLLSGQVPGVRRIKDALGVGQDKAQAIRSYLESLAA